MTTRLATQPPGAAAARLLTVADDAGAVVAVAVQTPPRKWIVASATPDGVAALVDHLQAPPEGGPGVFGLVETGQLDDAVDYAARHPEVIRTVTRIAQPLAPVVP